MTGDGMTGASSLEEFVGALDRAAARLDDGAGGLRRRHVDKLAPLLERGDTIIDGGNSWYRDDIDRSGPLGRDRGIDYVDVGMSGGVHGLERGYCLMVGGPAPAVERLTPIFDALAPGVDGAERTPDAAPPATERRRASSTVGCTAAPAAPATSSRWSTTASSTG